MNLSMACDTINLGQHDSLAQTLQNRMHGGKLDHEKDRCHSSPEWPHESCLSQFLVGLSTLLKGHIHHAG